MKRRILTIGVLVLGIVAIAATPLLAEGTYTLSGVTGDIGCNAIGAVDVTIYDGATTITTTSDASGNYTVDVAAGSYTVTASKTGYTSYFCEDIAIEVTGDTTLDLISRTGLKPMACEMSLVLQCINHWLYPQDGCGAEMSMVLAAVNAWLYPAE